MCSGAYYYHGIGSICFCMPSLHPVVFNVGHFWMEHIVTDEQVFPGVGVHVTASR
jgi:hypothetical protein